MAGELGDIGSFLKDGAVVDLDWLDIPEGPREPLPKQNLDVVPDLEAAWSHSDEPPTSFVPNTGDAPRTIGDMSDAHGFLRAAPEDIVRTARLVMMQSYTPGKIAHALSSRFDRDSLLSAKTALSQVLAERGLLGGYYIAASDFPGCNKNSKKPALFAKKYASNSKFVLAKKACSDCVHNKSGRCGVFHKELVLEVPYTEELAEAVERAKGAVQASNKSGEQLTPKERVRRSLIGNEPKEASGFTGVPQPQPKLVNIRIASKDQALATTSQLAKENAASDRAKLAAARARPIIALLKKEMLKGRSEEDLLNALKLSFDVKLLRETRDQWAPVFKQAGLYGSVYMHQEDFDDCRKGADFVNKHGSKVHAVVAGDKCSSCIFSQVGRCMMYGRKLVQSAQEVVNRDAVVRVVGEHKMAGTLSPTVANRDWGEDPAVALKTIYRAASRKLPTDSREVVEKAFYGNQVQDRVADESTKRNIVRVARQYLNEGLYGTDLGQALRSRFEIRDLRAARGELKKAIAEQGLQGIKYIDPTAYDDYGHGCHTAARLHRSRTAVKFAKVGPKCASCVHQKEPGKCSVLNKSLVEEPPYVDKRAEQQAVLESGRSMEVSYASLISDGLTAMQEYQLQNNNQRDFELNPEDDSPQVSIELGGQKVDLP